MINFFFYQIALFLNDLGFRVQGLGLRVLYLRLRVYVDCKILKGTLLNSKLEEQKEQLDTLKSKNSQMINTKVFEGMTLIVTYSS